MRALFLYSLVRRVMSFFGTFRTTFLWYPQCRKFAPNVQQTKVGQIFRLLHTPGIWFRKGSLAKVKQECARYPVINVTVRQYDNSCHNAHGSAHNVQFVRVMGSFYQRTISFEGFVLFCIVFIRCQKKCLSAYSGFVGSGETSTSKQKNYITYVFI